MVHGKALGGKPVHDAGGQVDAEVIELRDADIGIKHRKARAGVHKEQTLASLDDKHIGMPVVDARFDLDERTRAVTENLEKPRGAPQEHGGTVPACTPLR